MPWIKGTSGNPAGRPKSPMLTESKRRSQGNLSWDRLLQIRDGYILERKYDQQGHAIDVVPSIADQIKVNTLILAYCWGIPTQRLELADESKALFAMNVILSQGKEMGETEIGSESSAGRGRFALDFSDSKG